MDTELFERFSDAALALSVSQTVAHGVVKSLGTTKDNSKKYLEFLMDCIEIDQRNLESLSSDFLGKTLFIHGFFIEFDGEGKLVQFIKPDYNFDLDTASI